MSEIRIAQQVHSYRNGHTLAGSSIRLERIDQDQVDKLSDLAGPLGPGQTFSPYLTFYPLPGERFYVVAATWQDHSAPRAGCVITRSLFVPTSEWRTGGLVSVLLRVLAAEGSDISSSNEVIVRCDAEVEYPPVEGATTNELIEAMFLEKRQPIAVFGSNDGDLIATRLIEGVWPGMRMSLAICTHANSPRSLQGRPFDLLFAPSMALSNFASWSGRKIEGVQSNRQPRHHWTERIAKRLFRGAQVVQLSVSIGGITATQDDADESQFRLAMLWGDLDEKVDESPLAILGMLDILSSLRQDELSLAIALRPKLLKSISLAEGALNTVEFFSYMSTLLAKFPSRLPPTSALRAIRRYACSATAAKPSDALDYLEISERKRNPIPVVLCAGVADGFSIESLIEVNLPRIFALSDDLIFNFISHSRLFARALIFVLEEQSNPNAFFRLARIISAADAKLRDRVMRNLLPILTSALETCLVEALLANLSPRRLSYALQKLWDANKFKVVEFDTVLLSAADTNTKLLEMRTVLVDLPSSVDVDRILIRTLRLCHDDIRWIFDAPISSSKQCFLLKELIGVSEANGLSSLDSSLIEQSLDLLSISIAENQETMARLLLVPNTRIGLILELAPKVLSGLIGELRNKLVFLAVSRALLEGTGSVVSEIFENFASEVPSRDLMFMLSPPNIDAEQVSRNLLMVEGSGKLSCDYVLGNIDLFTDQLIGRRGAVPTSHAVSAWANLIELSGRVDSGAQLRAASAALEWALKLTHLEVSSLVMAAFPVVYRQLKLTTETPSFMTMFTFVDWDRCKTARRDLVSSFLKSHWPRTDLFRIAEQVAEIESFARLLSRSREGRIYLQESIRDVALPTYLRNELVALTEHLTR